MNDYKKDTAWGITLFAMALLPILLGLIPGITMMVEEDTGMVHAKNLLMLGDWNNGGVTGALITVVNVYLAIMSGYYIRNQSEGLIKGILIGTIMEIVVGVAALLTEPMLRPVPFFVIPVLAVVEFVLAFIRMKQEQHRFDCFE